MPIGTNFDDFLKEEGLYETSTAAAVKTVIALASDEDAIKNKPSEANFQLEKLPIQQDEQKPFFYLDDIQKNLDFLYQYSGVVGSMRAFSVDDQTTAQFMKGRCLRDFGHEVTVDCVCELGIFYLAELMLDFLGSGRRHLLGRVTGNKYFCTEVISVFYDLSKISSEERLEAAEKRAAIFSELQKEKAKKPRKKLGDGTSAKDSAKGLFKKWSDSPSLYRNKSAFNGDVVDKGWCAGTGTANGWLNDFIKTEKPSAGLIARLPKPKKV